MINKFYPVFFGFLLISAATALAQNVGIGTSAPNASAKLDVSSSSRGLLIPRMTTSGIQAIANPARGLLVYDSTVNQLMVNNGTAAAPNWQSTMAGSGWGLNGNGSTNPNTQFMGTIDNYPMNFRVGNVLAGKLDPQGNVFWGLAAGQTNYNEARGNVGIGTNALTANTAGNSNVGVGRQSLSLNTLGEANVAIGADALYSNTTGSGNIALGVSALTNNQVGNRNVAVGDQALLYNNYDNNVAVGFQVLSQTTGSADNTAVGYRAGADYDLNYHNIFIGANTGANTAGLNSCIAIGQDVYCSASGQAFFGNAATNSIGGYAGWSTFSDGRIKQDISENVKGLDFILKLRPVTYRLDMAAIDRRKAARNLVKAGTFSPSRADNDARVITGFVAQEVEKASRESGYDFGGIEKPKNERDLYTLRYGDFVAPLVKSLQELNARLNQLEKENVLLKQQIEKQTL
jgi:trimeric autotransporter adhesin